MTLSELGERIEGVVSQHLPLPGKGRTAERFRSLAKTAREDLSLAKLAEAHWDAVAILLEAGHSPEPGKLYAVWASEVAGQGMILNKVEKGFTVSGSKPFCSGIGIADRALITVSQPLHRLVEVNLRLNQDRISSDLDGWKVEAFRGTNTGAVSFLDAFVHADALVGEPSWYLERPGFWHGACGPAACWAGGVSGLVDFAVASKRDDPHTLAHLAAMQAAVWGMFALVDRAGDEIDEDPENLQAAQIRALKLRYLVEQMSADILRRFARAYGPYPLSMDEGISRRYQEVDLYMRQSHAERDLEVLAHLIKGSPS